MSTKQHLGSLLLLTYLALVVGSLAFNMGEPQAAFVVSWGHLWTAFVMTAIPALGGWLIAQEKA